MGSVTGTKKAGTQKPWISAISGTFLPGFEPGAYCLGGSRSILLSYRNWYKIGFFCRFYRTIKLLKVVCRAQSERDLRRRMLYPAELCRHTIFGLLRWRLVTRQSPKSCINAGFVARCLRAKSRFFSLFDHPNRWPIFSIFSRYFSGENAVCVLCSTWLFLIKILSSTCQNTSHYTK